MHVNSFLERYSNSILINDLKKDSKKGFINVFLEKFSLEDIKVVGENEINNENFIFISVTHVTPTYIDDSNEIFHLHDSKSDINHYLNQEKINGLLSLCSPLCLPTKYLNNKNFLKKYKYILPSYHRLSIVFDESSEPLIIYNEDTKCNSVDVILKSLKTLNQFNFIKFDDLFDFQLKTIQTSKIFSFIDCEIKDSFIKSCSQVTTINYSSGFIYNNLLYRNNTLINSNPQSLRSIINRLTSKELTYYKNDKKRGLKSIIFDYDNTSFFELESFLFTNNIRLNEDTIKAFFLYKLFTNGNIILPNFLFFKLIFKYSFKFESFHFISYIIELYNREPNAFLDSIQTILTKTTDPNLKNETSTYYTKYVVRSQIIHLLNQDEPEYLSNDVILDYILKNSCHHNTLECLLILFYFKGNINNVNLVIQNCPNQSSKNMLILHLLIACRLNNDDLNYHKYVKTLDFTNHQHPEHHEIFSLQTKILDFLNPENESINLGPHFKTHFNTPKNILLYNDIILIALHIFSKLNNYKLPSEVSSYTKTNFPDIDKLKFSQFKFLNLDSSYFDHSIFDSFNH